MGSRSFSDIDDESSKDYNLVWHNKLGIIDVGNGDVIAIDLNNQNVVYLSHDGADEHGAVLGNDFADYLNNVFLIGASGNESWCLAPFLTEDNILDSDCDNAKEYRELIGLKY